LTRRVLTVDDAGVTTETVGARVRRLRLARGLSQRALSGPGVSDAYISRIERGSRTPSLETLEYLAGRLGVDKEYLRDGRAIPAAKERELRLLDAEIALRMGGDLDIAEQRLRDLLAEEVWDGLEVRIRTALGAILARRGEYRGATEELERVVASGGVRPDTRPDVYETLSRAYLATNQPHEAVKLLAGCIAEVDEDDRQATAQIRYRSFLATALAAVGATAQAREVLEQATERAERRGGLPEQVALQWERARLYWMEGDGDAALSTLTYARALAQIADDTLQVARAHLFSAQILNLERRPEEAGPHLERAERLLDFGDDTVDRGALRAEQAKREAALGNPGGALELAGEAVELLSDHPRHKSNAWHAMGAAYAAAGDVDAADGAYERAVTALADRGQWREAVYVARAWADALRAGGREERAYAVLERATVYGQRVAAVQLPALSAGAELPEPESELEPRRSRA
jgi:transcriptional regulator with XRE-family HTH domain